MGYAKASLLLLLFVQSRQMTSAAVARSVSIVKKGRFRGGGK